MQPNLRHLIWFLLLLGFTSMIYFLSLPAHLPFIVTVLVVLCFGAFSFSWFRKNVPQHEGDLQKGDTPRAYIILVVGIAIIVGKAYSVETQYGYWDAWWLWDHHAKYLQDSTYWRELFRLDDAYHPDYPLFLSSIIAFFWRLIGSFDMLVPYIFSVFVALVFPCVIFLSLYTRNLTIAAIAFLMLALNNTYITHVLAFYADQPLGLLFLCALICLEYAREQQQLVVVIGALLGCCIWMKNEGMMLSLVFIAFNYKQLLANGNAKRFAAGIVLPVLTYAFLKLNAPPNDLVRGQGDRTLQFVFEPSRYILIGKYFYGILTDHALSITILGIVYSIYCYTARKLPGRNMLMLTTCAVGFAFVYVLTPHNLTWHLNTSLDRVLFQLVPSFIFVMARNLCNVRLSVNAEQFQ